MMNFSIHSLTLLSILIVFSSGYQSNSEKLKQKSASEFKSHLVSAIVNGFPSAPTPGRPFFVRLRILHFSFYCGGSIVDRGWVITAAHCVDGQHPSNVFVEVADFTDSESVKKHYRVRRWYIAEGFQKNTKHVNNIALLQLLDPIRESDSKVIPLCHQQRPIGTPLAACGLGTTQLLPYDFPQTLHEALFTQSMFEVSDGNPFSIEECRQDLVCGVSVMAEVGICYMDDGSPLFLINQTTNEAECVYGVSSFHGGSEGLQEMGCGGSSFFANVPYFYHWIARVIYDHWH